MPEYKVTVGRTDGTESTTTMRVEASDASEALQRVSFRVGVKNFEDKVYNQAEPLNPWLGVGYSDGTTG